MFMVAKIVYSKENKKKVDRVKPIYTNIPTAEEARYLAQYAITNSSNSDSIIVIIPANDKTLNIDTMRILDTIYKERGDKHE